MMPTLTPTPIPAFAPVLRPLPLPFRKLSEVGDGVVEEVDDVVSAGTLRGTSVVNCVVSCVMPTFNTATPPP